MFRQSSDTLTAAEDAVLNLLIAYPESIGTIDLMPADMNSEYARVILAALIRLHDSHKAVTGISLAHELRTTGELERIGGIDQIKAIRRDQHYLEELPRMVEILRDASMLSRMTEISRSIALLATQENMPISERYQKACNIVNTLESVRDAFKPIHIKDGVIAGIEDVLVRSEVASSGRIPGLKSSLKQLDDALLGIRPGTLVTVAGRTSMGKTVLAMQIARKACDEQKKVLVFSLEMSAGELTQRQCAAMQDIPLSDITGGTMSGEQMNFYTIASSKLASWDMWVDDRGGIDVKEIANVARRQQARTGLDMVIVDHIGLMTHRGNNLAQGIGETTSALKALSKELAVPVIMVAQLNREAAKGSTVRRPTLVDLQDSGRIEQDSDIVLLIHRPGYYDHASDQEYAEIIVAKNRQGARNVVVQSRWEGQYTRFTDWPTGREYQDRGTNTGWQP